MRLSAIWRNCIKKAEAILQQHLAIGDSAVGIFNEILQVGLHCSNRMVYL